MLGALMLALPALAQEPVVVAVVSDGPPERPVFQQELYVSELLALTESEFDITIREFVGSWNRESIEAELDRAYADPDVAPINRLVR